MPIDFSPDSNMDVILVSGQDDIAVPFSKGKLATSVLATGIETEIAYRIAAQVETSLRSSTRTEFYADEVNAIAFDVISQQVGLDKAEAFAGWLRLRASGRPTFIVLGGAPGVGKSTIATRLAVRLGITRIITTDTVREILRTVIADSVLPELHVSTYESLKLEVAKHGWEATFQRQAHAVGEATIALARRLATERRSAIIEGVHLLPGLLTNSLDTHDSRPVVAEAMLTLEDEELHRAHLTVRQDEEPGRKGGRHLKNFDNIRSMQNFLQLKAAKCGVPCYDVSDTSSLTAELLDSLLISECAVNNAMDSA